MAAAATTPLLKRCSTGSLTPACATAWKKPMPGFTTRSCRANPRCIRVKKLRILLLNQCFYPDHVSTAQHLTDLALGLVEAGHEVTVVAASRGYDNPDLRYPVREQWRGVDIRRIWTPGLGKTVK